MPPLCGYGCRQLVERDVGNESDPSDIETQNLRMQVEQLYQSLEHRRIQTIVMVLMIDRRVRNLLIHSMISIRQDNTKI